MTHKKLKLAHSWFSRKIERHRLYEYWTQALRILEYCLLRKLRMEKILPTTDGTMEGWKCTKPLWFSKNTKTNITNTATVRKKKKKFQIPFHLSGRLLAITIVERSKRDWERSKRDISRRISTLCLMTTCGGYIGLDGCFYIGLDDSFVGSIDPFSLVGITLIGVLHMYPINSRLMDQSVAEA